MKYVFMTETKQKPLIKYDSLIFIFFPFLGAAQAVTPCDEPGIVNIVLLSATKTKMIGLLKNKKNK